MSQDEQNRFNSLQEQLSAANSDARLYRNLFWSLLSLAVVATVVHLLQS
ncbi:MAG: hypothetical protein ACTHLW_21480 [Verrucomicrobiota bacterium]